MKPPTKWTPTSYRWSCFTPINGRKKQGTGMKFQVFGHHFANPIASMYGQFTYIDHKNQPNVEIYSSPMDGMEIKSSDGSFFGDGSPRIP